MNGDMSKKKPALSFQEILKIIPQRFPMIMIDKVIDINSESLVAIKNITGNEFFFEGHFPAIKIFPGVLLTESMAQATIILFNNSGQDMDSNLLPVLYHTDVRFKEVVVPGDQLMIQITMLKKVEGSAIVEAIATVEEKVVAKGKLTFTFKEL
ncbi:3-hydroxyacyl-ACP dehydratase FabZ [Sporosarcina limicola]|uniref:3-hydroxyacyl-[acyl-carrier-protein] dehydratase n=1 Tax=Sporosarcina limicola TaxID=34101 RepID=A0A927MJM9_9BACL|nr:3-hydroxyacyl-ACP dehydratase FabZ [Sporosarcina limicola]MBE1555096.1 3-hydroxyacyl-[acyl-carrier-protein] dehydratase [Sporosarcina limicola]